MDTTEKIDPECEYIKKWVTELKDIPVRLIRNLDKQTLRNYRLSNSNIRPFLKKASSENTFASI
jgi:deoxyribodipyrimidine photolyase